jgi:hypothetical protein
MYRYARCADRKDYAAFADVFCDEAVFDFSGTQVTGCAAIQQMMHNLDKFSRTLHQVYNTLYEVEADSASGETYCVASHLLEVDGRDTKIDMGITYEDRLRRFAGGWRIEYRKFNLVWSQTGVVDAR